MITLQEKVHGVAPPDDWHLGKFHRVLKLRKGFKNIGMQEDNLLSLSYGRIIRKDIDSAEGLLPESFETYQIVEPGNIVLRLTDLQNDKRSLRQGLVHERGIITAAYDAVEVGTRDDPRFWAYALLALDHAKYYYSLGGGVRQSLKFKDFPNEWMAVPDLLTQNVVADFLDRETARIDELLEKKQRLVELSDERKRTMTGEMLSRGTREGVTLRESGISWLGPIPTHWSIYPLKHLIWYQEGPGILADDFRDEGIPLLRIKGISGATATLDGCNYLDVEKVKNRWSHFQVELGDLLISASATRGGVAAEVDKETVGAVPYTGIIRIKPRRGGYRKELIPHFMLSSLFDAQVELLSAGSTIQHFGPSHLGRMKAPLPPQDEQAEIAEALSSRLQRIQKVEAQTILSMDRLREFRTSLITAAVTGRIDLTSWGKHGNTNRRLDAIQETLA